MISTGTLIILGIGLVDVLVLLIFGSIAVIDLFTSMTIPATLSDNEFRLLIARLVQAIAFIVFIVFCGAVTWVVPQFVR